MISIAKPSIGRAEIKAVKKVLKSGSLAQGPEVASFEIEFSRHVGDRNCVAVNSGTSALHVCLLSLGIGPGDEVIVPSFTFAATANTVALTGAKPIFVDIDRYTYCIDPSLIEQAITSKTRAIQVVHLYGLPANMTEICKIASKYGLFIIEDAAQAHLAAIDNKKVGTFGDAAAFSFYPTKNMTSGEGGMAVFKSDSNARTARLLRNQGMETRYQNEIVGYNLRMTDIHAAIGRVQLKKIEHWTEKRIENAALYSKLISDDSAPKVPSGYTHVYHQYTIRIPQDRDKFIAFLTQNGIGSSVYYPTPVHRLPTFNSDNFLPETENAAREVVSIPVHSSLTKIQLKKISRVLFAWKTS
jgi:perosamine synthetase